MGIIRSGILGTMENTTGAVVGRMHRGKNVLTSLYEVSESKTKGTKKQVAWRYRFGLLNGFLNQIELFVNKGFKKLVKHNTPINAAYKYLADNAFATDGDEIVLNYPKLMFSLGDVEGPESPKVLVEDGMLKLSWFKLPQSANCQYTDRLKVLIYCAEKKDALKFDGVCERWDGKWELSIQPLLGTKVHLYVSFASADDKLQGNSQYLGCYDLV